MPELVSEDAREEQQDTCKAQAVGRWRRDPLDLDREVALAQRPGEQRDATSHQGLIRTGMPAIRATWKLRLGMQGNRLVLRGRQPAGSQRQVGREPLAGQPRDSLQRVRPGE